MSNSYAGIGSRETPANTLSLMTQIAAKLSTLGFILRSGAAPGADTAFEQGADPKLTEIYLPWRRFNGSSSPLYDVSDKALQMAASYHPAWNRCSDAAKKLHARNCHQILGRDLASPVNFVICWTKDGGPTGGTGQAIRIANANKIPVFNLFNPDDLTRIKTWLEN